jgi:hypothetical protein
MDTDPRTTPEALAEFNHFYSTVHVHEVIAAHRGFVCVSRYELMGPDPRGGVHAGPRWLAVYGMADEAAAEQYIKDNARPWLHRRQYSAWPPARKRAKTVWRMIWRRGAELAPANELPETIALVGLNDATLTSDAKGPESDGNVEPARSEGSENSGAREFGRLELYREFAHPTPGCPPVCVVSSAAPLLSDDRSVTWSLVYQLIPPPV